MTSAQAESLYTLDGKTISSEGLSPAQQQQLLEVDKASTEQFQLSADKLVLESYFADEAIKQKKSREELEKKVFEVGEPSEKALKDWYEANKAKIPPNYEFEKIKVEIAKIVKQEEVKVKRDELLSKVKKDGKFALIRGTAAANSPTAVAGALYSFGGKTISAVDLTPAQQQQIFELEAQKFEMHRAFIDKIVLDVYFAEEAKKKSKTAEDVEKAAFDVKEPSEKALKAWYAKNKAHIPPNYEFDKIKAEIVKIVKDDELKGKRTALLEKVKKSGKFALIAKMPVGPTVDVKTDGYPFKGKEGSKLTVVEFADFQCSHCKAASEVFKKVAAKYSDKMKYVFVDFPINPSGISKIVAEGSHCAAEQNKYWEYHYKAFDGQTKLDKDSAIKFAKELKLDEPKFKACFEGTKGKAMVEKGRTEGDRIGVSGTPYLLFNGHRYLGAHTVEAVTKEVETYLK